jgi:hypothetical protein
MAAADDEPQQHEEVGHAPEALSRTLVLRVLAGTVAFSVALCFVAYVLLHQREAELHHGRFAERNLGSPHEVSEVKEELFRPAQPTPSLAAEQRRQLDEYRWVDRGRRVAHIPIAQAIDVEARALAAGEGTR